MVFGPSSPNTSVLTGQLCASLEATSSPACAIIKRPFSGRHQKAGKSHILAAGLATVQPWLDIPELGTAVIVVGAEIVLFSVALLLVLSQSPFFNSIDPLRLEDENEDDDDQTPF